MPKLVTISSENMDEFVQKARKIPEDTIKTLNRVAQNSEEFSDYLTYILQESNRELLTVGVVGHTAQNLIRGIIIGMQIGAWIKENELLEKMLPKDEE